MSSGRFIHTPPKSLFTKTRGTLWEPDPARGSSVCSVGYLCSVGYCENSAVKMPFVTHLYAMTCTHRNRRTHYMTNTVIMTDAISNGAAKPYPLGRYDQT